jgi:hypothetical protein
VYYNGGPVGIGGVIPTSLTETLTVNGNTSFVGNVTVTSDASGNAYVLADRVPTGSLHVSSYVTGSVPLTTTTNLIQRYLSNAATMISNTVSGTSYSVLNTPPSTVNSYVNFGSAHSVSLSNLAVSNIFIEAWVNLSTASGTQAICARRPGDAGATTPDFNLYLSSGQPNFIASNVGGSIVSSSNTTALVAGTWYHVAASWQRTGVNTGTVRVFTNGGLGGTSQSFTAGTNLKFTPTANVCISADPGNQLFGNVYDVRIMTGCIVPVATFTAPAFGPFTTAPTYRTGMNTGYTSNLTLALQSQYFPGASTSPYGPCLTLPGTVGSYYSNVNTAYDTNWKTNGFCLEAWVNYASLANSNVYNAASIPLTIGHYAPTGAGTDWAFGATTTGQLAFWYYNGAGQGVVSSVGALVTGQWTHVVVQSNGTNIWLAVNGTFVSGAGTAISGTPVVTAGTALTIGQVNNNTPPNFAVAKARLTFGTVGSPTLGNVYSSGNFTANPNFAAVPAGATVAWSLDSQYPLPTYPSIQDVTPLALQSGSFGAVPTPIGGVTSNVLSPYSTTYPQLDSIRFDGTGYIDYGNAASSVLTTNIWASNWTIEGWVYPTNIVANFPNIISRSNAATSDWFLNIYQGTGIVGFYSGAVTGASTANFGSLTAPLNTWTHIAATFDGVNSNLYVGGALSNSMAASTMLQTFTPTLGLNVGYTAGQYMYGNLADVRVSNVARYTGSSYTVPFEPHPTNNANTLLLLRSLGGQTGTTLEIQGRGLNAVSLGATRSVQSYPPAPMSSYLLDTTSNASVTYGQGKYIASASTESTNPWPAWQAFDGNSSTYWQGVTSSLYSTTSPFGYIGSVATVDTLGNSYPGEWCQLQMPVSVLLSSYAVQGYTTSFGPSSWALMGSRDGINWTVVDRRTSITWSAVLPVTTQTFTASANQAYTYYRYIVLTTVGNSQPFGPTVATLSFNGTEEALCVTSDAKVGVGIANPQRALEVAGDLVVSGTISGGAGMGAFRNRIINGDMRIAQRGTSFPISGVNSNYYYLDRWTTYATGTFIFSQQTLTASDTPFQLGFTNSLRLTGTGTSTAYEIMQFIEGYNTVDLKWTTSFGVPITVSFWLRSLCTAGTVIAVTMRTSTGSYAYNSPITITNPSTWQYVTVTIPPPPNGATGIGLTNGVGLTLDIGSYAATAGQAPTPNAWLASNYTTIAGTTNIMATAGNYIELTGVQLEKGTVATGFEQRPFAQELALCQRYFTKLGGTTGLEFLGSGIAASTTQANALCILPVPMRDISATTIAVSNVGAIRLLGSFSGVWNAIVTTAIIRDSAATNGIVLQATIGSASLTLGYPYFLQNTNTTAPSLGIVQINNEL